MTAPKPSTAHAPTPAKTAQAPTPAKVNQTFFEFQVEKAARPLPGNAAPRYPDALRASGVEGEVLAQFVVDTNGVVDVSTLKVLRSTDSAFTVAVREALPHFRFAPAEVGGRHLKQLMQMPFQFNLAKP
jgi:protein TonB